jgi:N6-adenosine-specific RNA methylase IME4
MDVPSPFPATRYDIIYADPPWAWSKRPLNDRGHARTVEKEYPTMQPDEIMALPVADLAKPDAVLLLWATSPKLPLALAVMQAWGFVYKTIGFVWVKRTRSGNNWFTGMGFYTRQNAELVLLGTRGTGLPRQNRSVHQIIEAPIMVHSRKPEEVRRRIDRLYTGDKIELFARCGAPGWDAWGFDAPSSPRCTEPECDDIDPLTFLSDQIRPTPEASYRLDHPYAAFSTDGSNADKNPPE